MVAPPAFKKRIRLLFIILVAALIVIIGTVHYIVVYRLKNAVEFAVDLESKGKYGFSTERMRLSWWNKTVVMKRARLHCRDTLHTDAHYDVKIREMFLSVNSWQELLFHKKVTIDSLTVLEPDINLHVHVIKNHKQHTAFQTTIILDYLRRVLTHLNARSLDIRDASFTYGRLHGPPALHSDSIDLRISNFTRVTEADEHILGSDDVTLSMGRQHWVLPDGLHEISFKSMQFNGREQRFETDSFSFLRKAVAGKGEILISAEKFFFNSRHLPGIYMRNELLIDSLICVKPVLTLPAGSNEHRSRHDTANRLSNFLFRYINVRYIDVIDGELVLQGKDGQLKHASTQKTNLNIYNLKLDPQADPQLSTDSIRMRLNKIAFLSKDSAYQLAIDEFSVDHNTVLFRNVVFSPSPYNHADKGIIFKAPSLLLKEISIEELMKKHIKAKEAELVQPLITFYTKTKNGKHVAQVSAAKPAMSVFYQSLHGVATLINVERFRIIDGVADYRSEGIKPIQLHVSKINSTILLNKLFVSDSLVDIKHAIPDLRMGTVAITSPQMKIRVNNYRFDGLHRHNWGGGLYLSTTAGMQLEGRDIYWEVFDWDIFQKTKEIQVDLLRIGELSLYKKRGQTVKHNEKKELPVIRIGKLYVNKATVVSEGKSRLRFDMNGFYAGSVRSVGHFFAWNDLRANLHDLRLEGEKMTADIRELKFDNAEEGVIKGIDIRSGNDRGSLRFLLPLLKVRSGITSTDLSRLYIRSMVSDTGTVEMVLTGEKEGDTTQIKGLVGLRANGVHAFTGHQQLFTYDSISVALADFRFNRKGLAVALPAAVLQLAKGNMPAGSFAINSAVNVSWQNAGVDYHKDSTALNISNLTGVFADKVFHLEQGTKPAWQELLGKIRITDGGVAYKGKSSTINIGKYTWDPAKGDLRLQQINITPLLSREATFKAAEWQSNYMIIKGEELSLSGINFHHDKDSLIHIQKIGVNKVTLNNSRDKRLPFRHGIEKFMPTKLISTIPIPLQIDSVILHNSEVIHNEYSLVTGKWTTIPIRNINGYLANIISRNNGDDTLKLLAAASILDNRIRYFSYDESYGDSLSYFKAESHLSPVDLTRFSEISMPMAAVNVSGGRADTVYSSWEGNKYAAYGAMNFFYRNLKIKVYDKKGKSSGMSSLKTMLANLILPDSRKRTSAIFVERDREKFIFNYWIRAQSRGVLSTVGIRKSRKYRALYQEKYLLYSLPRRSNEELKKLR